jgi:hypothetical protein
MVNPGLRSTLVVRGLQAETLHYQGRTSPAAPIRTTRNPTAMGSERGGDRGLIRNAALGAKVARVV